MTLWVANLAAYSIQLAALVGAGVLAVTLLRVSAPRATLHFWQTVFAASVLWPLAQLLTSFSTPWLASASLGNDAFLRRVLVSAAGFPFEMRVGIAALDTAVTTIVVTALFTGAGLRVCWLAMGIARLRAMRRRSTPAEALSPITAALQHELGARADVRFSADVDSPATIGARHPTVLLPPHVRELPPPLQRAVLCHELIHVRRGDWLAVLIEELWCAVFWFHPAARALASRLSLARETLVDQMTIALTRDRQAYAAALLEFSTRRGGLAGAPALIGRRHLERRIALIAQEVPMPRSSLAPRLSVAAVVVAIATITTTVNIPLHASLQAQSERVYKPGEDAGVTLPRVIREVKPTYTPAAMQAKIQGAVWMTVTVLASGEVGEVTVTRSLDKDYGLDEQAVSAARQWKFSPATKDGKAVPVEVTVEMTFTLKK
jgi:TonB family protein